ncbi:MAG: hypothetical protein HY318_16315 [Armatimonadetes bacterium]|nr:hypothetical protein [Armatimonadota bacterium]
MRAAVNHRFPDTETIVGPATRRHPRPPERPFEHIPSHHNPREKSAPVSPRRKHGQPLIWNLSYVAAWGSVFTLVMVYTLINAAAFAFAFCGRQLDNTIAGVNNDLNLMHSRIARVTSPDMARQVAASKGWQRVSTEQIDDLTIPATTNLAEQPDFTGPQENPRRTSERIAPSLPTRGSGGSIPIVLVASDPTPE